MLAENIMTTELTCVNTEQTLSEIHNIFTRVRYHHLPVTDKGKIIGIISDRDVSVLMSPFIGTDQEDERDAQVLKTPVKDIMTTNIITIDKTTSVDTASILLLENNISCLPVADQDNNLNGLLTWKDILNYYVYA
jgi:acetoin utilization protein AcuB